MWVYRLSPAFLAAMLTWFLTRLLTESPKISATTSLCVLLFGFLSTGQAYIVRRRIFRRDMILQYGSPILASAIVALIVRITHL